VTDPERSIAGLSGDPPDFGARLTGAPIVLDGGLATELEARGHDLSGSLWSARLLADDPDAIRLVHEAYFAAGAEVAISASYQASRAGFAALGLSSDDSDALMIRSVELASQARQNAYARGATGPLYVAASVGPYGATLADGSEYRGRYGVPHDELVDFHTERLDVLAASGADILAIETIPDVAEASAIVEALAEADGRATDAPVACWISFSCADGDRTSGGDPIAEAVRVAAQAPGIVAVGVNCTPPTYIRRLLAGIGAAVALPVIVYPNAGRTWDAERRRWSAEGVSVLPPSAVHDWLDDGVAAVGGCCGLGPAAVRAIAASISEPIVPQRPRS